MRFTGHVKLHAGADLQLDFSDYSPLSGGGIFVLDPVFAVSAAALYLSQLNFAVAIDARESDLLTLSF